MVWWSSTQFQESELVTWTGHSLKYEARGTRLLRSSLYVLCWWLSHKLFLFPLRIIFKSSSTASISVCKQTGLRSPALESVAFFKDAARRPKERLCTHFTGSMKVPVCSGFVSSLFDARERGKAKGLDRIMKITRIWNAFRVASFSVFSRPGSSHKLRSLNEHLVLVPFV